MLQPEPHHELPISEAGEGNVAEREAIVEYEDEAAAVEAKAEFVADRRALSPEGEPPRINERNVFTRLSATCLRFCSNCSNCASEVLSSPSAFLKYTG